MRINDYVYVKLTKVGHTHLQRRHKNKVLEYGYEPGHSSWNYTPPETDEDGYTRYHLWDLMETFGECMVHGVNPPFEPDILVPGA